MTSSAAGPGGRSPTPTESGPARPSTSSTGFQPVSEILREVAEELPPTARDAVLVGIRRASIERAA